MAVQTITNSYSERDIGGGDWYDMTSMDENICGGLIYCYHFTLASSVSNVTSGNLKLYCKLSIGGTLTITAGTSNTRYTNANTVSRSITATTGTWITIPLSSTQLGILSAAGTHYIFLSEGSIPGSPGYVYVESSDSGTPPVVELTYTAGTIEVNVAGVWKLGIPYVNVAGVWKQGTAYINVSNTWKIGT